MLVSRGSGPTALRRLRPTALAGGDACVRSKGAQARTDHGHRERNGCGARLALQLRGIEGGPVPIADRTLGESGLRRGNPTAHQDPVDGADSRALAGPNRVGVSATDLGRGNLSTATFRSPGRTRIHCARAVRADRGIPGGSRHHRKVGARHTRARSTLFRAGPSTALRSDDPLRRRSGPRWQLSDRRSRLLPLALSWKPSPSSLGIATSIQIHCRMTTSDS